MHISLKTASFLIAKIDSYVLPKGQGLVKIYVIKGHRLNVHSVVKISIIIVANSPSRKKMISKMKRLTFFLPKSVT